MAWDLIFLGQISEALSELQRVPPDDYRRLVAEAAIATRSKRTKDALLSLEALRKRYGDTIEYQVAQIYSQIGDRDKAIDALRTAWALRDSGMGAMQVDPFLDPLRNDPRFAALVKQVFG